jgi:hypothetical protein
MCKHFPVFIRQDSILWMRNSTTVMLFFVCSDTGSLGWFLLTRKMKKNVKEEKKLIRQVLEAPRVVHILSELLFSFVMIGSENRVSEFHVFFWFFLFSLLKLKYFGSHLLRWSHSYPSHEGRGANATFTGFDEIRGMCFIISKSHWLKCNYQWVSLDNSRC